jgi:hypothetical protein
MRSTEHMKQQNMKKHSGHIYFSEVVSLSKFFYIYLLLEKLVNGKYFPVKEKFSLVFRKVFS